MGADDDFRDGGNDAAEQALKKRTKDLIEGWRAREAAAAGQAIGKTNALEGTPSPVTEEPPAATIVGEGREHPTHLLEDERDAGGVDYAMDAI